MNRRWLLAWLLLFPSSSAIFAAGPASLPSDSSHTSLPCAFAPQKSTQWYDQKLDGLVAELRAAASTSNDQAPLQAALLERIYDLRNDVSDPAQVDAVIAGGSSNRPGPSSALPSLTLSPLARTEAGFLSLLLSIQRREFSSMEGRYTALGYPRSWRISDAEFPIEADGSHWRPFAMPPGPWLEAGEAAAPNAAYVTFESWIQSDRAQDVVLRLSTAAPAAVEVNRGPMVQIKGPQELSFDQYRASVHLEAGVNRLRVRLFRASPQADFRVGVRISDIAGNGISLPSSTPAGTEAFARGVTGEGPAKIIADDLLSIARAQLDAAPTAINFETLFWLERSRRMAEAATHLQKAAALAPTPERLFEMAQNSNNPTEKLDLLHRALSLDADFLPASLKSAELYSSRGENYKAIVLLNAVLERRPCESAPVALLHELNQEEGDSAAALAQINGLFSRPELSIRLKSALANQYAEFGLLERARALANAVYTQSFAQEASQQLKIRLDEQALDAPALLDDYKELHRLHPYNLFLLEKLIALENQSGRQKEALAEIDAALNYTPDGPELLGAREELVKHSAQAVLFPPAEDNIAASEALRKLLSGHAPHWKEQDPDARYMEDVAMLATKWRARPSTERQSSRILAEVRIQRLSASYLSSIHIQKVMAIGSLNEAERYEEQSIRYSPGSEELTVVRAEIVRAGGTRIEAEDLGDSSVADAQSAMYYDVRARNIRFAHLQPGDVIALEYRVTPLAKENPYGHYFAEMVSFGSELHEDLQRYVLIAPRELKVYYSQKELAGPKQTSGLESNVYRWEGNDVNAVIRESRSPSWSEQAPYIHVSSVQSWQELGRWYAQLIAPQFALDASLEQVIQWIRTENHTELEKIRAVHEYVVKNTHYVALEFGIFSYKPYPVTQTFARKFGDCKDKASLIIAMLRAMNIDAEIALVRTHAMGKVEAQPASVAIFDHAIAYVPKYDLWLDGTAEFSGLRELPTEDQGAMALIVNPSGDAELRQIPVSSPLDNYTWRSVQAQLEADGTLRFSGVNYVRGQDAPDMRRDCERVDRQQEFVRGRLAQVLPSVEIQAVSVPGERNLEEDFTLSYRGEIQPVRKTGSISIPSSWIPRPYLAALAAPAERRQPLLFSAPWTTEEELHISLTKGVTLLSLPEDVRLDNQFGSATLRYTRENDELVVYSSVQFRKLRIEPEEYSAFRSFVQTLDESFRRELQVAVP